MKNLTLLLYLFLLALPISLMGQNLKNKEKSSYVVFDLKYESDAVFMGRNDSVSAPYLVPSLGFYDKSGFFADASLSYLTKSEESRIDLFLLTTGYQLNSKKLSGLLSGTKYFFSKDSYSIQSEIEGDLTATLGYDLSLFKISLTASSYFSSNSSTDFFAGIQLDKSIYALDDNLEITPTFNIYGGSQYFYQEYYTYNRLGNRKGKNNAENPSINNSIAIKKVNQFNVLNLEISLPIQFQSNSFLFSFTPHWAFPQSNATITTNETILKEDLKNIFYWSAGISYWLNTKKRNKQ